VDDLCANSDVGLCGRGRADLEDWGEEYDERYPVYPDPEEDWVP
jgi:hypothetical protein